MLTSMNLRDYLLLKVRCVWTSLFKQDARDCLRWDGICDVAFGCLDAESVLVLDSAPAFENMYLLSMGISHRRSGQLESPSNHAGVLSLRQVELEGTSGEGSRQVKAFRPHVRALLAPLAAGLMARPACAATAAAPAGGGIGDGESAGRVGAAARDANALAALLQAQLMAVYEDPDCAPGERLLCNQLQDG